MADILLSHGYFLNEDDKEQQIMKPYAPLGLLYLSAYLKREGFAVEVYDSTLRTREALYTRLAGGPGVLGLYTNLVTSALGLGRPIYRGTTNEGHFGGAGLPWEMD